MSTLKISSLAGRIAGDAPTFTDGLIVPSGRSIDGAGGLVLSGIATLSGGVVGNVSGNLTGNITGNTTIGGNATIQGDLTVSGSQTIINSTELNIQDKTVGIASTSTPTSATQNNSGIEIYGPSNVTLLYNDQQGGVGINTGLTITGFGTFTQGADFNGNLKESVKVTAGKLSDNLNINLEDGMIHYFTSAETTTSTPNLRYNATTSLNSKMNIGEAISVNIITTAATAGYSAELTIDGGAVTENWTGGNAPSAGGGSGVDLYAYTIIKTADATFTVIGNLVKTSS